MKPSLTSGLSRRDFLFAGSLAAVGSVVGLRGREAVAAGPAERAAGAAIALPELPYAYNALEPHIDARTMEIHHSRHHAGYTRKLLAALERYPDYAEQPIEILLADIPSLPAGLQTAVRNNGGGYWNHSLFWNIMSPNGGGAPTGKLAAAIDDQWGGFDAFKEDFSGTAASQFGSGWGWLSVDENGDLIVSSTPNQDNPLMNGLVAATGTPILGVDVWEHAYYLHYQNRRGDYIAEWWNVVDWDAVDAHYRMALA